ncbi:hypothetical protein PSH58_07265 [Pseudomonas hefeiensis]|uniref:Uncharacterized protein n=1 Tax=Pseudomonas hefeiensis TaxID=2738125 RepID=A0ABY9GEU9_9PSED|nr:MULTISPECIES: hypothetical protein [unclassified Pseudomonas]WLH14118.1 hypothetical protein PSH57_07260 [Pseudomonas sp. FP205]WLH97175.1 hypothetical protein PSH58_07265 [Pseudomonas sp. FP53]WLI41453.1 hypothetical protein PSH74_07250 [Pseudomonas sp. FP821]
MLMHPFLDRLYDPQIGHFLGGFEVYDCEETLGEELLQYDIECARDRKKLIYKYVVHRFRNLSYRHKFLFFCVLAIALDDPDYDFSKVFEHEVVSHSALPPGWDEMEDFRVFFEDIYKYLAEEWSEELDKASQEDPTTW